MVDQELIERVTRLPVYQRLELIERLTHSLREELAAPVHQSPIAQEPASSVSDEAPASALMAVERLAQSLNLHIPPDSALRRIIGVLPSNAAPMTKHELRDLIADSLIEKHS